MSRPSQNSVVSPLSQPNAAEVRAHLGALLRDEALAISDRNRRFLAYVVEETLAGRGDRIKAYNVALTAFDRTDDFDPQTDPIVRIEASRLRRALEHYYLTAGKGDPLRIGIPKGSYVATFSYVEGEPAAPRAVAEPIEEHAVPRRALRRRILPLRGSPLWWITSTVPVLMVVLAGMLAILIDHAAGRARTVLDGPSIQILPFEASGGESQAIARGITAVLVERLMPLPNAAIFGPPRASSGEGSEGSQPDLVLSGSAYSLASKIFVSAALVDARTGRYLWSWNAAYGFADHDVIAAQTAIAADISGGIAPFIRPQK